MRHNATYFYDEFGIRHRMSDLAAVNKLETLKKKSGSNPWPVIEEIISMWKKTNPKEWESALLYMDDIRETRKDPEFGSSTDKETGGILRYTIDVPLKIMNMIRAVYSPDELPMESREFWQDFARHFPTFKVAEKL